MEDKETMYINEVRAALHLCYKALGILCNF